MQWLLSQDQKGTFMGARSMNIPKFRPFSLNFKDILYYIILLFIVLTLSCPGFFGHSQTRGCLVPPSVIPLSDLQST